MKVRIIITSLFLIVLYAGVGLAQEPATVAEYNKRGLSYTAQDKFELAAADFTRAIQINPLDAGSYKNRGYAYHKQDKSEAPGLPMLMSIEAAFTTARRKTISRSPTLIWVSGMTPRTLLLTTIGG